MMENAIEHRSRAPVSYVDFIHEKFSKENKQGHFLDASDISSLAFFFRFVRSYVFGND